jgi:hypothetical protein
VSLLSLVWFVVEILLVVSPAMVLAVAILVVVFLVE